VGYPPEALDEFHQIEHNTTSLLQAENLVS
jgi:hypothetical protein